MNTNSKYLQIVINLNTSKRKFFLILFTVGFAFISLNVFEPFGLYHEGNSTQDEVFMELVIAMGAVFFTLLISQFILRRIFKIATLTILTFSVWFLVEIIMISFAWLLLDIVDGQVGSIMNLWVENVVLGMLIIFIPYFTFALILHIKDVTNENNQRSTQGSTLSSQSVNLVDESGATKLIISTDDILYLQSADNYLEINYLEKDKPAKLLLRNTIKVMEEQFVATNIIRCHRSYMVNTSKIKIAKKVSSGFNLTLNNLADSSIPVSKSYTSEFRKHTVI